MHGRSTNSSDGVFGESTHGRAGFFVGRVAVAGTLEAGTLVSFSPKPFRIDHPLDPANEYLKHAAAVESAETKNVYDGVAQLGEDGSAWVELPGGSKR